MKQKKHTHMILVVIILIGAFLIIRSAIVGQVRNNIKDADFQEDALKAQAGCTPPTINSIAMNAISNSGATLSWTTNQSSTTEVKLGTTTSNMSWLTPAGPSGVTMHSYQLSGLQASRVYYYRVRSSNGSCQKTSNTFSFTTLGAANVDTIGPSVPTIISAVRTSGTTGVLTWNTSTDPAFSSGIKNYEVYGPNPTCNIVHHSTNQPSGGFCGYVTHNGSPTYSMTITGLVAGRPYSGSTGNTAGFTVLAFDNANNNSTPGLPRFPMSATVATVDVCPNIAGNQTTVPAGMMIDQSGNCVAVQQADVTPPSTPANLTSPSRTTTSVSLSWSVSTDNAGGSGMSGYNVYMNGSTNPVNGSIISGTTYTATGLTPSTSYTFNVKAKDVTGNMSAASSTITVTTNAVVAVDLLPPTQPTGLASSNITQNSFRLSWNASTDDTLPASQIIYDVYGPHGACNALNEHNVAIPGYCGKVVGSTFMQITGLTASTTYSGGTGFIVQAHDTAMPVNHYSTPTPSFSVTTAGVAAGPLAIINLQDTHTATQSTITWTTSNGVANVPATTVVNWGVTPALGSQLANPTLLTAHSVTIPNLTPSTTYYYTVTSVAANGDTASISGRSFTTSSVVAQTCVNEAPLKDQRHTWIWKDVSQIITPGTSHQNRLLADIALKKINMVYLDASTSFLSSAANAAKLKTFMNTLGNDTNCTRVQLLSGDVDWPSTGAAHSWAVAAKAFDQGITGNGIHPYGLNVDVEPYAIIASAAGRTSFINMLTDMKSVLASTGMKVTIVIPRWYDTTYGNAFVQSLINASDEIAIMDYTTNANTIFSEAQTEVGLAKAAGKKAIIGLETIDLSSFPPEAGTNGVNSFWGTSCATLNNAINASYTLFQNSANFSGFGGFAIHDYYQLDGSGWDNLCPN